MKSSDNGHSLPEIIVILGVLGIAISLAMPHETPEKRRLRLEVEKAVDFIKQAQTLAFYNNKKVKVQISANALHLQPASLVTAKSQRVLHLPASISFSNYSHARLSFSPAGTGTASHITISSSNYSCRITNSIFNRLRQQC